MRLWPGQQDPQHLRPTTQDPERLPRRTTYAGRRHFVSHIQVHQVHANWASPADPQALAASPERT